MPKNTNASFSKKYLPNKVTRILFCILFILCVLIVIFVFRGWIRESLIPKSASVFYLHAVASTLEAQDKDLGAPLSSLGLSTATKARSCSLLQAQGLHEVIDCQASEQSYAVLPHNLNDVEQQAAQLQTRLKTSGWKAGSNGVTLMSLIDGIAHGKDYSPDANYEKIIGSTDCVLDVMIAYGNPQPPALRAMLWCDRTLHFLGVPQGRVYDSSKGHMQ